MGNVKTCGENAALEEIEIELFSLNIFLKHWPCKLEKFVNYKCWFPKLELWRNLVVRWIG